MVTGYLSMSFVHATSVHYFTCARWANVFLEPRQWEFLDMTVEEEFNIIVLLLFSVALVCNLSEGNTIEQSSFPRSVLT
jgi:hypothetical protein